MRELAVQNAASHLFEVDTMVRSSKNYGIMEKEVAKSRNRELRQLFQFGIGIHHAGMLRSDRLLTERMFEAGILKVLVCTATLAWGVNLPAYAVVIKGTQVYDSQKGSFVDLSILDVLQIFGRAGRPQYEPHGLGYIVTTHDKLTHYITHIASRLPIESQFSKHLVDNLNAEIASTGSVSNLHEAVQWLGYTYLYVRMRKNPQVYGMLSILHSTAEVAPRLANLGSPSRPPVGAASPGLVYNGS
jgi:replicative superfamily II helicase